MLANHLPLVLRIAGLTAFAAVGFQGAFIYIAEWLQTVAGASPVETFKVTSWSMLLVTPVSLLFGWWADHVGRRNLLLASAVLGAVGSVPFFMLMQSGSIYWGQAGFVLALSIQFGVQGAMMVEITPATVRCTALAIGNNIGWSILGGLTPLAATWLTARTGDALAPAWLVAAAAAITAVHPARDRRSLPQQDPLTSARGSAACAFSRQASCASVLSSLISSTMKR